MVLGIVYDWVMKITQSNDQLIINEAGRGQLIGGILLIIVGIVLAIVLGAGLLHTNGNKPPAWSAVFGLVFLVVGALLMRTAQNAVYTLQKGGNTVVDTRRLIGGKSAEQSFPTASIVAVRLETYFDYNGVNNNMNNNMNNNWNNNMGMNNMNGQMQRRSTLSLLLNNNDLVQIGTKSSGGGVSVNGVGMNGIFSKAPLSNEANQIATFLGVPLQANDETSLAGGVQAVTNMFKQRNEHSVDPVPNTPAQPNMAPIPPAQPTQSSVERAPSQQSQPPSSTIPPVG